MSQEITLEDYIKRYWIEHKGFYFPKISVLNQGQSGPPKYTLEEVKKEYDRRQQRPD